MKASNRGLVYRTYPASLETDVKVNSIISCFKKVHAGINSFVKVRQESNVVLKALTEGLLAAGFEVETGKKAAEKITIPVLFGLNGKVLKSFDVDAASLDRKVVLEVEAGRAVVNHQFLKDLFESCVMPGVEHLVIAVRNTYNGADDFEKVCDFISTLYASSRFRIPLNSITIIGY